MVDCPLVFTGTWSFQPRSNIHNNVSKFETTPSKQDYTISNYKFHLRCQMLQTYKATSIIQRQIPPSIHIIRYQSNSKLINHHQSRGFLTNPISETSPMSHGFALASPWPFFAAQGTKAQQVLDKFCSVKSWICTTASRAMAINTYGHRFDQGYLVGG